MKKYCPNCHKEVSQEAFFCDNCGTRLTPVQPSPITTDIKPKKPFWKTLLKILFICCILFIALFLVIVFLENVYHRIPPMPTPTPETTSSETIQTEIPQVTAMVKVVKETASPTTTPNTKPETPIPTPVPTPTDDIQQGLLIPNGNPQFDEFLFYENDVYNNGLPKDAIMQPIGLSNGSWKYCLTFNRTIAGEERIDEIGLADLTLDGDNATLILHPQMIRYGTHVEPENEQDVGYQPFTGTWDNEYIDLSSGDIAIGLGPFYTSQGSEYMLGNIVIKENGLFGDVLLVRP